MRASELAPEDMKLGGSIKYVRPQGKVTKLWYANVCGLRSKCTKRTAQTNGSVVAVVTETVEYDQAAVSP